MVMLMARRGPEGRCMVAEAFGPAQNRPTHSPPTLPGGRETVARKALYACANFVTFRRRARAPGACASWLLDRDPLRRPVSRDHLADQVPARYRAPSARVARLAAVVSHEEVMALFDSPAHVQIVPIVL